jgi:cell division septation protein DedD
MRRWKDFKCRRDAPPAPIQQLAKDVLAKYAAETEMEAGRGAAGRSGRWRVYAARTKSQDEALAIYDKLRESGYPATINPTQVDGGTLYQARITGLLSEADGTTMAIRLKTELGLEHVAVSLQ